MSGRHLGTWKMTFGQRKCAKSTNKDGAPTQKKLFYDDIQQQMQQTKMNLLNCALKWERSFRRWQQTVTNMIRKTEGCDRIHQSCSGK